MAATNSASSIADNIQDMIAAKMSGDFTDLVDKKLDGCIETVKSSTLAELRRQHEYWSQKAMDEDPGEEVMIMIDPR